MCDDVSTLTTGLTAHEQECVASIMDHPCLRWAQADVGDSKSQSRTVDRSVRSCAHAVNLSEFLTDCHLSTAVCIATRLLTVPNRVQLTEPELLVYGKGDHFDKHMDRPRASPPEYMHVGTLCIIRFDAGLDGTNCGALWGESVLGPAVLAQAAEGTNPTWVAVFIPVGMVHYVTPFLHDSLKKHTLKFAVHV